MIRSLIVFVAAFGLIASGQSAAQSESGGSKSPIKRKELPLVVPQVGGINTTIKAPESQERIVDVEVFSVGNEHLRTSSRITHRGRTRAALQSFSFAYENGDHQTKSIGLINNGESVTATFADHDGDDPFTLSARYVSFPGFFQNTRLETVSTDACRYRCTLRLPSMSDNETALLAGFSITRRNDDSNIRGLSIELLPDREVANITFYDDQGIDHSGFLPLPLYDIVESIGNTNPTDIDVNVEVQVLIVPKSIVKGIGRIIGGTKEDATNITPLIPAKHRDGLARQTALMGFGFAFTNEDHFLKEIAVDLYTSPAVKFADGDGNDRFSWFVDFATFETVVN
jgi:hypothetical protein